MTWAPFKNLIHGTLGQKHTPLKKKKRILINGFQLLCYNATKNKPNRLFNQIWVSHWSNVVKILLKKYEKQKWNRKWERERERDTTSMTTAQTETVMRNTTWSWLQQFLSSQLGFIYFPYLLNIYIYEYDPRYDMQQLQLRLISWLVLKLNWIAGWDSWDL